MRLPTVHNLIHQSLLLQTENQESAFRIIRDIKEINPTMDSIEPETIDLPIEGRTIFDPIDLTEIITTAMLMSPTSIIERHSTIITLYTITSLVIIFILTILTTSITLTSLASIITLAFLATTPIILQVSDLVLDGKNFTRSPVLAKIAKRIEGELKNLFSSWLIKRQKPS